MERRFDRTLALLLAAAALLSGISARADVLLLDDGSRLDGKVIREEGGFVWLKTLQKTERIAAEKIKSRTAGEALVDRYERLRTAVQTDPVTAAALWDLYLFQKEHAAELPPETTKENPRLLARILKKDPQHAAAHAENGEVNWDGKWVKQADLAALEAARAHEDLVNLWQQRLRVPCVVEETDHYTLVDNTGERDLGGRGQALEKAYAVLTEALGVEALWKGRCSIITIRNYDAYCKVVDDFGASAAIHESILDAAKDRKTGGMWRQKPDAFQIRWPATGAEGMWSAIVHNVAHVAVWTHWRTGEPPAWINEGMGAWVEIEVTGQQVNSCMGESKKLGDPPPGGTTDKDSKKKKSPKKNAQELAAARGEYKQRCIDAITADEFPPMRQFLKYGIGDLGPKEEGGALGLVTWLMHLSKEKFRALFKIVRTGGKRTEDEAWREAYGFEVIEEMEKQWRMWAVSEW
jgi:hypothetical protein